MGMLYQVALQRAGAWQAEPMINVPLKQVVRPWSRSCFTPPACPACCSQVRFHILGGTEQRNRNVCKIPGACSKNGMMGRALFGQTLQ
jgi:hypothetical protein